MNFVGLDLSLTGIGLCHQDGTTSTLSSRLRGIDRIIELRDAVMTGLQAPMTGRSPDLVLMEDYSFGSGRAHAHELGELGGAVKVRFVEDGQPYMLVPPASLKKFATGKGNANKIAMAVAASKCEREFADDNQCDAWWLFEMGWYRYCPGDESFALAQRQTSYRDEAISKLVWPELELAA